MLSGLLEDVEDLALGTLQPAQGFRVLGMLRADDLDGFLRAALPPLQELRKQVLGRGIGGAERRFPLGFQHHFEWIGRTGEAIRV
jgi:hypothetical protein